MGRRFEGKRDSRQVSHRVVAWGQESGQDQATQGKRCDDESTDKEE